MTGRAPLHAAGPFERYRAELALGTHWYLAALRAAAVWTLDSEVVRQRRLVYLIDGQALDLLLVIERLVAAGGGAKADELERLLFDGQPPIALSEAEFRDALGPASYTAYLNSFYGITVEEALHCAVELEAAKSHALDASAGLGLYERIYGRSLPELLAAHAEERGAAPRRGAWPGQPTSRLPTGSFAGACAPASLRASPAIRARP